MPPQKNSQDFGPGPNMVFFQRQDLIFFSTGTRSWGLPPLIFILYFYFLRPSRPLSTPGAPTHREFKTAPPSSGGAQGTRD